MKIKTEIGVMFLRAKEHKRLLPPNHWKLSKRNGTDSFLQPSEGINFADTFYLGLLAFKTVGQ